VIRSDRVVLPDGVRPATLVVAAGRIAAVLAYDAPVDALDVTGLVVSPGVVDSHVHINEPGRTHWEGFASATRAAAAGGVTSLVDMPLNSIPATTTLPALRAKQAVARDQVWVDVAFWGGITSEDTREVPAMAAAGVCGFKVFLVPSGVDEFCCVGPAGLRSALAAAARVDLPVVVHAEAPGPLERAPSAGGPVYADYVASRPPEAEVEAVLDLLDAVRATGGRAHVLHVSAADCLPLLAAARREGLAVSAETCPHYLSLAAEEVPDGRTAAKCAPPVRGAANRELLWAGLAMGSLDCVVSDHSPSPPELKSPGAGDFAAAWGGIAGLQTALPVVWTQARARGHGLLDLARWQSAAPAELAGLVGKGSLAVGNDADLVVWDPDATFVVDAERLLHRHKLSAWDGARLHGVVHSTWVRGRRVDVDGAPHGSLLERGVQAEG
jgi:allantoinase